MAKHHKKIERNQHHLLWTRKTWTGPFAQKLRSAFVVDINWNLHEKLHIHVEPIPVPSEAKLEQAWHAYELDKYFIQPMSIPDKIRWLIEHIDDQDFCEAMDRQLEFFTNH